MGKFCLLFLLDLLIILGIVLVLFLISPLFIWRFIVFSLARAFKRQELGSMLGTLEMVLIHIDPPQLKPEPFHSDPDSLLAVHAVLNGSLDVEQFRKNFLTIVIKAKRENGDLAYDRLQQHVTFWLGYAFFAWDKNFDIKEHVREVREEVTAVTLHSFIGSAFQAPFPKENSMWEILLLPNYNGEDKTLFYFRFSHMLGDGYSFMQLLNSCLAGQEVEVRVSSPKETTTLRSEREPILKRFIGFYSRTIGAPRGFLNEIREISKDHFISSRSGANDCIWTSGSKPIPLAELKKLKQRCGVSLTLALNTAISTALRTHVRRHFDVGERKWLPGFRISPSKSHLDNGLVNDFNVPALNVDLAESIEESLEIRLAESRKHLEPLKTSTSSTMGPMVVSIINKLPISIFSRIQSTQFEFMYSNFPGPALQTSFWGSEVSEMMFWIKPKKARPIPYKNSVPTISISIFSYQGFIQIGTVANSVFVEDQGQADEIIGNVTRELESIMALNTQLENNNGS